MRLRTIKKLKRAGNLLTVCWFAISAIAIWISIDMGTHGEVRQGHDPFYLIIGNLTFFLGGFAFLFIWKQWIKQLLVNNGLDGLLRD